MVGRSRRHHLRRLAGVAALGLAGCVGTDDAGTATPTTSGGSSPGLTPTSTPGTVVWQRSLDGEVAHEFAMVDGTVVVGDTGAVYGLDAADGSVRWRVDTGEPAAGAPVVADGTAYVVTGSSGLGAAQTLRAINVNGGEERWTFEAGGWWLDALDARDSTVYVGTADDAIADTGQTLYALDGEGNERWSGEIGDPSDGVATGETVTVGCWQSVYAFGAGGDHRWTNKGPEYQYDTLVATPAAVAYVGTGEAPTDRTLYVLEADTGEERWTASGWFVTSTRRHDGTLFAGGERVAAFDPATGTRKWETADPGGSIYDAPVVDAGIVASGETVAAYDLAEGTTSWRFTPESYLPRATTATGGTVLVRASHSREDRDRLLHGVDADGGSERWTFEADAPLTEPVVASGRAVAGSEDGTVYGFVP